MGARILWSSGPERVWDVCVFARARMLYVRVRMWLGFGVRWCFVGGACSALNTYGVRLRVCGVLCAYVGCVERVGMLHAAAGEMSVERRSCL